MQIDELINLQISEGNDIFLELDSMRTFLGAFDITCYDDEDVQNCRKHINTWQLTCKEILISTFGEKHRFVSSFKETISKKSRGVDYQKEFQTEVNNGLSVLESISATLKLGLCSFENTMNGENNKTPKIFISHKSEDRFFADALVNLINFIIGPDGDKIFCSTIPGYGIKQAHPIMDELKAQFDNFNIYMIIIHSPRYYKSAVCLNEMGASWALGTKFSSFVTKDCDNELMCGVINRKDICIDFKENIKMLNAHLNDFKNDLISFFGAKIIDENKWETARDKFVEEVNEIKNISECDENNTDLFEKLYLPAFDHIFELLDLDHFSEWANRCAISGNSILSEFICDNLEKVVLYIRSRPKHREYESWDSLTRNLGLLIDDFINVYFQHAVKIGEDRYYIERFYKIFPQNRSYDVALKAYNQHIWLVSDIIFEIARLCNHILSKIREQYPEYKKELGNLYIYEEPSDLLYREEEISDAPYPGIEKFIKDRLTREVHYGDNPRIGVDGYEKP